MINGIGNGIGFSRVEGTGGTPVDRPIASPATNIQSTAFQANWQLYPGAVSYELDVSTDPYFGTYVYKSLSTTDTFFGVVGLTLNQTYYYRVRGIMTGGGVSLNSNVIMAVTSSFTGLLDTYSGAAAAYSLRQLKSGVTNAIQVRRASDNATQDIGFVSGQLDTSTLETFCSGTNGFVTTWYDQSGNGYDASQTTAASQPKIVSSGSTILENGKPCVQFNGTSHGLKNTTGDVIATNGANSVLFVAKNIAVFDFSNILWAKNVQRIMTAVRIGYKDISIFNANVVGARFILPSITNNDQYLFSSYWDGSYTSVEDSFDVYGNNSLLTALSANNAVAPTSFAIGYRDDNNSQYFNGNLQELIIYPSDQSSNRSGISDNINSYYSIY